jgi:hypothetical protein
MTRITEKVLGDGPVFQAACLVSNVEIPDVRRPIVWQRNVTNWLRRDFRP